jgi:hypothetical protein
MFPFDYITVIGFNEHSKAKIFLSHIEKQGDMHKPFEFSCRRIMTVLALI